MCTLISAKLVVDFLLISGVTRVLSVDLYVGQIQGFFNIFFDNLFVMLVMFDGYLCGCYGEDLVFVLFDVGGVECVCAYSKCVGVSVFCR